MSVFGGVKDSLGVGLDMFYYLVGIYVQIDHFNVVAKLPGLRMEARLLVTLL